MRLRRILLSLLAALGATAAFGQGTIQQSGPVTNGHVPSWAGNGVVQDGGGPTNPAVNGLGIYDGVECPFGVSSQTGPGASTSSYAQTTLCQTGTASTFKFYGINGAPTPNVYYDVGGVLYPFPFAGSTSIFVVPNASNFGVQHLGTYQSVYLAAYGNGSRALGDGGEGMFTQGVSCANDGGITGLQDADGHLFCRTNQNGSLAQGGITVGSPYDTATCQANRSTCTAADSIVAAEFVAASAAGLPAVHVKGVSFLINAANLAIPAKMALDCDYPPVGQLTQAGTSAVPYPTLGGFIVLNPAFIVTGAATSTLKNCSIMPTWYTSTLLSTITNAGTTRSLIDNYSHSVTGTAIRFGDSATLRNGSATPTIENVEVFGFDTCLDITNTPLATYQGLTFDCNVGLYDHQQSGTSAVTRISSHTIVESLIFANGASLKEADYPITSNIADDGSGRVQITYTASGDQIQTGDSIFIDGLGDFMSAALAGTLTNTSTTIAGISNDPSSPSVYDILIGAAVTDTDSGDSACIPNNTVVTAISYGDPGSNNASVTISNAAICSRTQAGLTFLFSTAAPQAFNNLWKVAAHAVNGDGTSSVTLQGSSFSGPTDTNASWVQGANAIKVNSTMNVGVGQYLCSSGTPPFCTAPTGWVVSPTTLSDNIGTGSQASVHFATTAHWPTACFTDECRIKIDTEILGYVKINPDGTVNLGHRALNGTTLASHSAGATVTIAAPEVIGVAYSAKAVLVNSTAQSTHSAQTVTFANDQTIFCTICGQITLPAQYHFWTSNTNAGASPSDRVQGLASASGTTTLTVAYSLASRAFPGMGVADLTTPSNVPTGATVVSTTNTTIVISGSAGTFASDLIKLTGCGYPANQPWLGNCAATAYLFTSHAIGVNFQNINAHGWRVNLHMADAAQTFGTAPVFDSGGVGGLNDSGGVGEWVEGNGAKISIVGGKTSSWTGVIIDPSTVGSGVSLVDQNDRASVVSLVNLGALTTSSLHGSGGTLIYLDSRQTSFLGSAIYLPTAGFSFDNPTVSLTSICSSSVFADTWCGLAAFSFSLSPIGAPPAPSSGWTLFTDQVDGNLKAIASSGTVITVGSP